MQKENLNISFSNGNSITLNNGQGKPSGEDIIGKFNSENRTDVDLIKEKAIELVDLIYSVTKDRRRADLAVNDIEKATMMAVKSLF